MFGQRFPLNHKFKLKDGALDSPKMRKRGRYALAMRLFKNGRTMEEVATHPDYVEYLKKQGLEGSDLDKIADSSVMGSLRWLVKWGLIEGAPCPICLQR